MTKKVTFELERILKIMSLIEKLKPKQGTVAVINSPKNILSEFKSLKPVASIPSGKASVDFALLFATNS